MFAEDKSASEDDIYYYCSKMVRYRKSVILKHILDLFESTCDQIIELNDIYNYLRKALAVSSVNRSRLYDLFNENNHVSKDFIYSLYTKALEKESSLSFNKNCHKPSIFVNASLKEIVEMLGFDLLKACLKFNCNWLFDLLSRLQHIGEDYAPDLKELKYDTKWLLDFYNEFTEEEFLALLNDPEAYKELYELYAQEWIKKQDLINFIELYSELAQGIHENNHCLNMKYIIASSEMKIIESVGIIYASDFLKLKEEQIVSLFENSKKIINIMQYLQSSLAEMLSTKFMSIVTLTNRCGNVNSAWERYMDIMQNRIDGQTLEESGSKYLITRERVRQIEVRYFKLFNIFFSNKRGSLAGIMRAFAHNEYFITTNEIRKIIKHYSEFFIYLLKQVNCNEIIYVDECEIFYFPDDFDWYSELLIISEKLPDSLSEAELDSTTTKTHIMFAELGIHLPYEYCKNILKQDYQKLGTIYSRASMPLSKRYEIVLKKYFPQGMSVYDKPDIEKFRAYYIKTFKDNKLPKNNRALSARIADTNILCDRGTYKAKQKKYISAELECDIYDYIMNSDKEIFLTNTLYYVFEDRLVLEGVDNKYYLQGILGECFKDKKLYFKRDYISKAKDTTSLYTSIIRFIKEAGRAITKNEIKQEFPGIPEVVISIACSDENIVVGFASYVHIDVLLQNETEIQELDEIMKKMVASGEIKNAEDLMDYLAIMRPNLLEVFGIENNRYNMFSVMQALFNGKYEMQRPFFAKKGITIGRQEERIKDFLMEYDELAIEVLMDFVKENKFQYYGVLDLINSLEEFVIKNNSEIIRAVKARVNKYKIAYIDDFIDDIIGENDFIVTSKIKSLSMLPIINIEWSQWLLYSTINKWSKRYKTMTTNGQFRLATPIIVKRSIPANNLEGLIKYEKESLGLDEISLIRFMREKGVIEQ